MGAASASSLCLSDKDSPATRALSFGASPRASLALVQAGRALAWVRGQDYVSPEIIQELFLDCLRHRIGLTYEAEAEEITCEQVLHDIVEKTEMPRSSDWR